jgi:Zn-dependent protease with chaperone function
MNRLILFIQLVGALALAQSCAKEPVLDVGEFAPYVARFEDESRLQGNPTEVNNLIIRYGEMLSPMERGACEIAEGQTPSIIIRQETWDKMDEFEREELLFHEMGHCVLRRMHKSDISTKGVPSSIMNPYLIRGSIYRKNQGYYLRELFRGEAPEELARGL